MHSFTFSIRPASYSKDQKNRQNTGGQFTLNISTIFLIIISLHSIFINQSPICFNSSIFDKMIIISCSGRQSPLLILMNKFYLSYFYHIYFILIIIFRITLAFCIIPCYVDFVSKSQLTSSIRLPSRREQSSYIPKSLKVLELCFVKCWYHDCPCPDGFCVCIFIKGGTLCCATEVGSDRTGRFHVLPLLHCGD